MNREILFRGKNGAGEWLYGYLTKPAGNPCFIIDGDDYFGGVIEETIGQFTGLTDKNGTKIFEGDIVEFETNVNCTTNELKPYWKDCIEKQYEVGVGIWWVRKDQAVVQWNLKYGMWDLKVYNNGRYKRKSKLFTYRQSDYVVIGNIYDNPELLEENK